MTDVLGLFDESAPRGEGVVYESARVTVVHDRAERRLADWPTESFDLVLTDPPYGKRVREAEHVATLIDRLSGEEDG